MKCSGCGKLFVPRSIRRFTNNFCTDCLKKKLETDNEKDSSI
jgi:DNA-directed RNA polymerase subunit RPC12/RpoP